MHPFFVILQHKCTCTKILQSVARLANNQRVGVDFYLVPIFLSWKQTTTTARKWSTKGKREREGTLRGCKYQQQQHRWLLTTRTVTTKKKTLAICCHKWSDHEGVVEFIQVHVCTPSFFPSAESLQSRGILFLTCNGFLDTSWPEEANWKAMTMTLSLQLECSSLQRNGRGKDYERSCRYKYCAIEGR